MQMRGKNKQEQRQQRLIQQVAGNSRRRRFTTETPLERELRLENQREQRRRRRQQETTEQRENRLAQRRQRRQQVSEEQRNRRLEYHRQYSYFVTRLDEVSSHWLDQVMNAEWKWLRFEWQARGSIPAHGCAKLSNDPGFCNLVKSAAQGWKLE